MSESYDENYHPNRRKEDRHGRHVSIQRQVNITLKAGAIAENGTLVICMGNIEDYEDLVNRGMKAGHDGD